MKARASSVVRLFIDQGIAAKRLKAVGSADPVLQNDSAEGRARNRRVTITVLTPQPETEPTSMTPLSAEQQ
ncbi:MAG: hypothetical protein WAW02_03050 [Sideroxyarcus sp.]